RRRVREALGRDDDGEGPARDLRLRVGVPDAPPEPDSGPRRRNGVLDVEPAVQLRLLERRQGSGVLRRHGRRARAAGGRAPVQGDVPVREAGRAGLAAGMRRRLRTLILVAGCLVLALDVATLGYAFTRGGGAHLPKYPGLIAVRAGCGVQHMFFD